MPQRLVLLVALLAPCAAFAASFEARLEQGAAFAARGDRVAARAAFETLVAEHPERPEPLNDLAALVAADGDYARARELLERALATSPNYRTIHDNLAVVYAAQAGEAYRRALPLGAATAKPPELALLTRGIGTGSAAASAALPSAGAAPPPLSSIRPTVTQAPRLPDAFDAQAAEALAAVDDWIQAWATRDVAGYLAAYAAEFVPPGGLTRAAWATQRAERIRAPQRIEIEVRDRHLVFEPDGQSARLSFVQRYRSDRFNGDSFKTLTLVIRDGRWQIAAERTGR